MLLIETQPIPLAIDEQGVARVSGTRVTLETIVSAFLEGDTAEEIAAEYPSVPLADIYAVISFYLKNQEQVDEYLVEQRDVAQEVRRRVEARCSPVGIRQRLMARKAQGDSSG